MFKYAIAIVIALVGATGFAVEPHQFTTQDPESLNIRQNHILKNIPLKEMPILDRIQLYEQIKDTERLVKKLNPNLDRKIFLEVIGFTEEEVSYLKDVHDIYEQVQLEETMSRVLDREPAQTTTRNGKVVADVKWLYKRGYTFEMQEAANGKLETYEILWADQCWGRPLYLVKTPDSEEIIMQESEITNWKHEPPKE